MYPLLIFSSAANQPSVIEACSISVWWLFVKQNNPEELEKTISVIMEYQIKCVTPNNI